MAELYVEASFSSRVKLVLATLLSLGVAAAMEIWWQPFMGFVDSLPLCDKVPWLRGVVICFALLFLLSGFLAGRAGVHVLRSGQSPLPGAWVWSRTRVKSGWRARLDAYIALGISASMVVAPIAMGYVLEVNYIFCFPTSCGCP